MNPEKAIALLKELIATPSFSKEEGNAAFLVRTFLENENISYKCAVHNTWAFNKNYDPAKPTLLLNSHVDTVRPGSGWTRDPFEPAVEDGKIYGLGSNDAAGALCSLLAAFSSYYDQADLPFNLVFVASAEEENSGKDGIEIVLPHIGKIDAAIVGEPTQMNVAVAEKGLLVLDCTSRGKAGHAARAEGVNAIYEAMKDIAWFRDYRFGKSSEWLGDVKMTVTMINAGKQHNVVPGDCTFTVDVRVTDAYTHEEILDTIRQHVKCEITPRSFRLRSSSIANDHPIVKAAVEMKKKLYGSPTTSDQALIAAPSIKMGPGDSARSHTPDEFILVSEIENGISDYIQLLENFGNIIREKTPQRQSSHS